MTLKTLDREELKGLLLKNWMTHDALWYGEVASKFGMGDASPMNLRVCRRLGQIECKRLMTLLGAMPPQNMTEYQALMEAVRKVFVPDFMNFQIAYPGDDTEVFHVKECFAHKGMVKAGVIADYACGIFERIEGWLDAMGLEYTLTPDLSHCLKYQGGECMITIKFHFKHTQREISDS